MMEGIYRNTVSLNVKGMTTAFKFLFIVALFFNCACSNEAYEKQARSLDSLSGALNQKLSELKQVDTVVLQKALSKYNNYKQFIQQNINDTVNKEEADQLQQFYSSGKNLESFYENRKTILARGSLINSQLTKLIQDAKHSTIEEEKLSQFSQEEKIQTEQLIKHCQAQQQLFLINLQDFKLALPGIEALIRSRNNGEMPTIIKDSIPL